MQMGGRQGERGRRSEGQPGRARTGLAMHCGNAGGPTSEQAGVVNAREQVVANSKHNGAHDEGQVGDGRVRVQQDVAHAVLS